MKTAKRYFVGHLELTKEQFDRFMEVCRNPPEPTEALKKLMKEYGRVALDKKNDI